MYSLDLLIKKEKTETIAKNNCLCFFFPIVLYRRIFLTQCKADRHSDKRNTTPHKQSSTPTAMLGEACERVKRNGANNEGKGIYKSGHKRNCTVFVTFQWHDVGHNPVYAVHTTCQKCR